MNDSPAPTIGFVGVGTIAAAVARVVLSANDERGAEVVLSPRSASRSAELAEHYDRARIAADNREVVEASDIVVLGVLPEQVAEVCAELPFREEQIVVSVAAGWPPSTLAKHVAPARRVCQIIPLPMIELGVGPIVLHPRIPEVEALLQGGGEVVVVEEERDIIVFSCLSAVMSSFFEAQNTMIDWGVSHGVPAQDVKNYVAALLHGLATQSLHADLEDLPKMPEEHETPGGINAYIRHALFERDGFGAALTEHLEHQRETRMQKDG